MSRARPNPYRRRLQERPYRHPARASDAPVLPTLHGGVLIGDKVYASQPLRPELIQVQNLELIPRKMRHRGSRSYDGLMVHIFGFISSGVLPQRCFYSRLTLDRTM